MRSCRIKTRESFASRARLRQSGQSRACAGRAEYLIRGIRVEIHAGVAIRAPTFVAAAAKGVELLRLLLALSTQRFVASSLAEARVEVRAVFVEPAIAAPNAKALVAYPEDDVLLLPTGLAVRFEASFVSAFLVATRTSPAHVDFAFEEAFFAKPLAAVVAKIRFGGINLLSAIATREFATPAAETVLVFGAGAAESTQAVVADFHLRGGNDEFTIPFAPPEVQLGFVLDANHGGHFF